MAAAATAAKNWLAETRWHAVRDRRIEADGLFVFAVRSTGIFCRPGCPARTPKPQNVEFFNTCDAAEAAGYRPCLRCQPTTPRSDDEMLRSVVAVCRMLEEPGTEGGVAELARAVGWSPRHLARVFKRITGVTIAAYARAQQAERARRALRRGAVVTDAVYEAGYGSPRAFYEHGAPRLGGPPETYRRGSPGVAVRYALAGTALGRVLVARTDQGICAVRIGDNDGALAQELEEEFAAARVIADPTGLEPAIAAVSALADGRAPSNIDLPFDLRGTAFQAAVWEALRDIKPGERRTYGEVAAAIGRPSAYRAVAGACAANPAALLVPCHRVVRGDGRTGGYRWGPERKAALLEAEKRNLRSLKSDTGSPGHLSQVEV